ncbi:ankyrin repeat-containing domain protein [Kockovaella imperatae]|uniref:Ankyrin repeat-containing domain protein n=1 Tax=Kockovaella imperatae TaxID=4999 RepID=A0A1Y1UDX3_9TREE|nr:ankyrin repeat-containing domain protein [Kockovaella imperatae]ORX36233.1 ankyrin repeat-containing domain protein [Kockovaella imperatae]
MASIAPSRAAPPPPPQDEEGEDSGASARERLLAGAKHDNEELVEEALNELEDINHVDGLGNTALHYAIIHASTSTLEPILCHDSCDVDIRNRQNGDTPLHIAVRQRWEDSEGLRLYLVQSLLEAGADTKIRNRYNEKPVDLLPRPDSSADPNSDDEQVRAALRKAEAEAMVADRGDIVQEDDLIDPNDVASDSD